VWGGNEEVTDVAATGGKDKGLAKLVANNYMLNEEFDL